MSTSEKFYRIEIAQIEVIVAVLVQNLSHGGGKSGNGILMDMLDVSDVPVQAGLRVQMRGHKVCEGPALQLLVDLVHALPGNHVVHDDHINGAWLWMLVPLGSIGPQAVPQPLCGLGAEYATACHCHWRLEV